jgi:thymidylate kinase
LIQFAGTSCGAGKSTLSRALAPALAEAGRSVEFVEEDALFRLPELAWLADRFRRRDFPSAGDLLAAFEAYLAARPDVEWIVNDGSWVLLAEDLPWAQRSREELVAYTRRLRELAAPHDPVVFFLDAPAAVAVARARVRDGDERFDSWIAILRRHPPLAPLAEGPEVDLIAGWGAHVRAVFEEAGWPLVPLPAGEPKEVVLAAALEALGVR